jgi:hypothetical protein
VAVVDHDDGSVDAVVVGANTTRGTLRGGGGGGACEVVGRMAKPTSDVSEDREGNDRVRTKS